MNLALVRKRTIWLPTWRGWLALGLALAAMAVAAVHAIHPFLAISQPVPSRTLVVDGWLPDYALRTVLAEYRRGGYRHVCTTGGPLPHGSYLLPYRNFAVLTAARLRRMGFDDGQLIVAPAADVATNRTFASARAVQDALKGQLGTVDSLNLMTMGIHARRSRMVYSRVFGPDVRVGVIACPSTNYDPARWWRSSAGLKAVIGETLSWAYEWLLDSGRAEEAPRSPNKGEPVGARRISGGATAHHFGSAAFVRHQRG